MRPGMWAQALQPLRESQFFVTQFCIGSVGRKDLADDLKNYERKVAEGKLSY